MIAELAAPAPGQVVVDLGCGRGGSLAAISERGPAVRLIGLDRDTDTLTTTRALLDGKGIAAGANLSRPLPLPDRGTDAVVCHNVLELLAHPESLLAEAARVLRAGGTAVWGHTDFAGLVVHGTDPALTDRICHAYAHLRQRWMAHIDPHAARRLPSMIHRSPLRLEQLRTHTIAATRIQGHAGRRIEEITQVARGHADAGATDLTHAEIDTWRRPLGDAEENGDLCFTETAFLAVATQPSTR